MITSIRFFSEYFGIRYGIDRVELSAPFSADKSRENAPRAPIRPLLTQIPRRRLFLPRRPKPSPASPPAAVASSPGSSAPPPLLSGNTLSSLPLPVPCSRRCSRAGRPRVCQFRVPRFRIWVLVVILAKGFDRLGVAA